MQSLFGDVCQRKEYDDEVYFEWDVKTRADHQSLVNQDPLSKQPVSPSTPSCSAPLMHSMKSEAVQSSLTMDGLENAETQRDVEFSSDDSDVDASAEQEDTTVFHTPDENGDSHVDKSTPTGGCSSEDSDSEARVQARKRAYDAALEGRWETTSLISTRSKKSAETKSFAQTSRSRN